MTHTLTPREKVELKPCPFCGGEAWLNDYEAKYSDLPPKSRCPQCRSCGASLGYLTTPAKATEAWNRRTALASGSGDHAELARLAEAATAHLAGHNLNADGFGLQIWGESLKGGETHVLDVRGWGYLTGGGSGALGLTEDEGIAAQRAIQAYVVAAWNAAPALLAEIAALRSMAEKVADGSMDQTDKLLAMHTRATEAERKLAEAVGLLSRLCDSYATICADSGLRYHESKTGRYAAARAFLSKEAERG